MPRGALCVQLLLAAAVKRSGEHSIRGVRAEERSTVVGSQLESAGKHSSLYAVSI